MSIVNGYVVKIKGDLDDNISSFHLTIPDCLEAIEDYIMPSDKLTITECRLLRELSKDEIAEGEKVYNDHKKKVQELISFEHEKIKECKKRLEKLNTGWIDEDQ